MLLERKTRRRHVQSEGSWAVSYVDMLTLLLCFFIIFYNTSQQQVDAAAVTPLAQVIMDLNKKAIPTAASSVPGAGVGTGTGTGTGTGEGGPGANIFSAPKVVTAGNLALSPADLALLELIKTKMGDKFNANTLLTEKSLNVSFEGVSFFKSGATRVRKEALPEIEEIIKILSPHKDMIRVVVQGHTDSQKIAHGTFKLSDNWELSVLRATSVLKVFLSEGFNQDSLSAEGFADTQNGKLDIAQQRRITLRIEPQLRAK